MPDIIDNQTEKLIDHVCQILPQTESVKFAVGYFFVNGLQELKEHFAHVAKIQLLIGNQTNQQTIDALMQQELQPERVSKIIAKRQTPREKQRIATETQAKIRAALAVPPLTDSSENLFELIQQWLNSGKLEVRVYTKEKFHAKAYLFSYKKDRYEDGIGIVGSSNLTVSGLKNNTELNVLVHGNDNFTKLNQWFENLWADALPFSKALMQEIKSSWASKIYTPWDIYLKTLYKLVEERLEYAETNIIHWDSKLPPLTRFQQVAVDQGLKILRDHQGVFISDVVGLGKTFIGIGLLKHLQRTGLKRQVIICPNALEKDWSDNTCEYEVFADVVPLSKLSKANSPLQERWIQDADVVLIDESHNFRNANSQRYEVVEEFLRGKKVILLTATPRNNSAWDLYNQIRLFQDDATPSLNLDTCDNLKKYFKEVDKLEQKARYVEIAADEKNVCLNQARHKIEQLLQQVLIRRRRNHIKKYYPDEKINGKPIVFPTRQLKRLDYNIDDTYNNLYDDIRHHITKLNYSRYSIGLYVKEALRGEKKWSNLARAGRSLRGIMRVLLLKRFESSVVAFRNTVTKMLKMHDLFLKMLLQGYVIADAKLLEKLEDADGNLDFESVSDDKNYKPEDFYLEDLERDLRADMVQLSEILKMVTEITPEQDDKLQTLLRQLQQTPLAAEKVIIFTQYSDTARYLYEQIEDDNLAVIDSKTKNKMQLLQRFSPRSNHYTLKKHETELRIIIATDVFSEGLNLQDAAAVINYDLHWNPVRLIQRVGRVDRIGSQHDMIYIYNFFPETALDEGLGLRELLRRRIQEIHDTIGEDEQILDEKERLNEADMYSIYNNEELCTEDQEIGFDINEAEMLIRNLRDNDKATFERIRQLPDGIRAAKSSHINGTLVFCGVENYYKRLYLLNEFDQIISSDPAEILPLLHCEVNTPSHLLPSKHNQHVEQARSLFKEHFNKVMLSRKNPELSVEQNYVLTEFHKLQSDLLTSENQKNMINHLISVISQPLPSYVLTKLRTIKRNQVIGSELVEKIDNLVYHFELEKRLADKPKYSNIPITKIYCSESLCH
jgi:superfamily II DNA or RNA helicase